LINESVEAGDSNTLNSLQRELDDLLKEAMSINVTSKALVKLKIACGWRLP
jgi:hypothetical protein